MFIDYVALNSSIYTETANVVYVMETNDKCLNRAYFTLQWCNPFNSNRLRCEMLLYLDLSCLFISAVEVFVCLHLFCPQTGPLTGQYWLVGQNRLALSLGLNTVVTIGPSLK